GRQEQEEERRRLAVEGVERRDVADVREREHEEARDDGLRRRSELAARTHESGEREQEERGVDRGERAQVERAAEQSPMDAAGGEGEQGLRREIAAPEPERADDRIPRPDEAEVALGVVESRMPESGVPHDALVVAVVGEADDRRDEELQGERRRGGD